jgi:uncharacterized peroxidase-related enzyme
MKCHDAGEEANIQASNRLQQTGPGIPRAWLCVAMVAPKGDQMPRIAVIEPAHAEGKAKQLLDAVQTKLGLTPNLMKTLANSPAALEAFLGFGNALAGGVLDAKFRERIALAVAQANSCEYCLAAHTALGGLVGLRPDEIRASRESRSADPRQDAGLKFAQALVVNRGDVSDAAMNRVRAAGFTDAEITEIVANVVASIFTNYFNHVARTIVDFPRVELALGAAV